MLNAKCFKCHPLDRKKSWSCSSLSLLFSFSEIVLLHNIYYLTRSYAFLLQCFSLSFWQPNDVNQRNAFIVQPLPILHKHERPKDRLLQPNYELHSPENDDGQVYDKVTLSAGLLYMWMIKRFAYGWIWHHLPLLLLSRKQTCLHWRIPCSSSSSSSKGRSRHAVSRLTPGFRLQQGCQHQWSWSRPLCLISNLIRPNSPLRSHLCQALTL